MWGLAAVVLLSPRSIESESLATPHFKDGGNWDSTSSMIETHQQPVTRMNQSKQCIRSQAPEPGPHPRISRVGVNTRDIREWLTALQDTDNDIRHKRTNEQTRITAKSSPRAPRLRTLQLTAYLCNPTRRCSAVILPHCLHSTLRHSIRVVASSEVISQARWYYRSSRSEKVTEDSRYHPTK